MTEYRLSKKAQCDLDEIFDYTVAQGCGHIRPGYRRRGVEHHVIYFKQTDYGIAVIRILHQRMDAPRHL
jgi:toxin ParE1/3/4